VVLLILLRNLDGIASIVDLGYQVFKVGWAALFNMLEGIIISLEHFFKSIAFRLKDVPIDSKAVTRIGTGWNDTTKPIDRNLFVRVILLKNVSNRAQSLEELVVFKMFAIFTSVVQ
jgi:hypothetical protein